MYCRIYRLIADIRTSLARDPSVTGSQKQELLKLTPSDFFAPELYQGWVV